MTGIMTGIGVAQPLFGIVVPWFAAAASIWLTWWAARSRDGVVWVAVALTLVVVPALVPPAVTMSAAARTDGLVASHAFLVGLVGAATALVRAVFLAIWAAVSRDAPYLRGVGVIIALTQLTGIAAVVLASLGLGL